MPKLGISRWVCVGLALACGASSAVAAASSDPAPSRPVQTESQSSAGLIASAGWDSVSSASWANDSPAYADLVADDLAAPPPTAVYDIMAHIVVLPDGVRLEAHSGLGERVDDPRFVALRMRGATPPALYDLAPRERLFHGVAALRLHPVGGEVFGRTGLLAHTYMLRGRPESNGCVVFRDYAAFLSAYRGGRIKRLRVVPSVGNDARREIGPTAKPAG